MNLSMAVSRRSNWLRSGVGVGYSLDESVEAEASEVVGHRARGHRRWVDAQQWREVLAEVSVGEPVGQEAEHDQNAQQCLNSGISEAKGEASLTGSITTGAHTWAKASSPMVQSQRKRSVNPYAQVTDGTGHSARHRVCWWSWEPSPRTIVSTGGL